MHLADLPGDRGEHLGRLRPAGHQRRDPPQRALARRQHGFVLVEHPLGAHAVVDVGEGDDGAAALGQVDRHRDVRDREHRPVAADEPVQLAGDGLAARPREQQRALRRREGAAVGMLVVDRLVAVAPGQLLGVVVAERGDRGRVGEPDHTVGIHDPDRLPRRLQHGGEEILSEDPQAGEIGQGIGHEMLRRDRAGDRPRHRVKILPAVAGLRSGRRSGRAGHHGVELDLDAPVLRAARGVVVAVDLVRRDRLALAEPGGVDAPAQVWVAVRHVRARGAAQEARHRAPDRRVRSRTPGARRAIAATACVRRGLGRRGPGDQGEANAHLRPIVPSGRAARSRRANGRIRSAS